MMHNVFLIIICTCMTITFGQSCCKALGPDCQCRTSCAGGGGACSSSGGNLCGTQGVCCCGTQCTKPLLPDADLCPTNDPSSDPTNVPSINPTSDPTNDPSKDPTSDPTNIPTNDPTSDPTSDPTNDPTSDPTNDPTSDPTLNPTIGCPKFSPETQAPTSPSEVNNSIPIPDFTKPPQLCQTGKSGTWRNLDQWYTFDCSCYDVLTLYKLNQMVAQWFVEFQINFEDEEPGRFEEYFNNYAVDNITFATSLTTEAGTSMGPSWSDLDELTSCNPETPGYAELTRTLPYNFEIAPGGIYMEDCTDNGNLVRARINIINYRIRDNNASFPTENQVSFGAISVQRQPGTNIWLFNELILVDQVLDIYPKTKINSNIKCISIFHLSNQIQKVSVFFLCVVYSNF